jgi:tetratricopeptide (TPR) repeat protein
MAHFSHLVEQQEAQPKQPQFAQTYVLLGNEYQKNGYPDQARAIWQRGLRLFPQETDLQAKLNTAAQ